MVGFIKQAPGGTIFACICFLTVISLLHARPLLHLTGVMWCHLHVQPPLDTLVEDLHIATSVKHLPVSLGARVPQSRGYDTKVAVAQIS